MIPLDPYFTRFEKSIDDIQVPLEFNNPFDYQPHELCLQAAQEVQETLQAKQWDHNFGLEPHGRGLAIGKMFGVLVVKDDGGRIGYLVAFSGKIGNSQYHLGFVPPIFDGLKPRGSLEEGMKKLDRINAQIRKLESQGERTSEIATLKKSRTKLSNSLQDRIYDGYQFLNGKSEKKSLRSIFKETYHTNPPGGAGDCAAPKLLQYAFRHGMQPLSLAEFWWGHSVNALQWKHKHFYPACTHKCEPILKHMLKGIV